MITIFVHGCVNCGVNAVYIRQIKAYAQENDIPIDIKNSKYDEDVKFDHLNWLRLEGMDTSSYQPIVVEGNSVKGLRHWNV